VPTRTASRPIPLEDQLARLLETKVPATRDQQLVCRVLGWDGQGGCSLTVAGDEAGITRERSRQIYQKSVDLLQTCTPGSLLDEVLAQARLMCNRDAENVQAELQLQGLTKHCFGIRALLKTARIFGRNPDFTTEETGGKTFVVAGFGVVSSILKAALRSSSHYGIQTVTDMCVAIPPKYRRPCDHLLVRQVLHTRNDLFWLDGKEEWFWLASVPRNPVATCVKKLLHYAKTAPISDVHRAISRLPRMRNIPVTREAVVGFCRQAPFCNLTNQAVSLVAEFATPKLLDGAEATVCRILERNGNELPFKRLQVLCESAGVTQPNLWRILMNSPLIFRRVPGVYRVVTATPGPGDTLVTRRTA
jgi:hypothetical protein